MWKIPQIIIWELYVYLLFYLFNCYLSTPDHKVTYKNTYDIHIVYVLIITLLPH